MAAMEPRYLGSPPGSGSGGSGGQSVDKSARWRRRMSAPSTGTLLMPAFNAVAGDGDGGSWGLSSSSSSSSSSGGLDLGLDESRPRYSRPVDFSQMSNMGRLLFQGSPLGSRTTDDDVLVMDGVLVANGSGSGPGPRRYASLANLGFVNAASPRSGDSGRRSSSLQFAYGKEEPRVPRAMNPRNSEVELQSRRSVQGAGRNMQASPGSYHPLLPPWLQAAGRSSPGAATTPIRPPATDAYFTPPRATTATPARAPTGFSWTQKRPESKPPSVQRATFTWPPTEEENAAISQCLYGPRRAPLRRLPVFASICPA